MVQTSFAFEGQAFYLKQMVIYFIWWCILTTTNQSEKDTDIQKFKKRWSLIRLIIKVPNDWKQYCIVTNINFLNRILLDVFSLLKCLVIVGGETCSQFQTRIDVYLTARKISTIFKYQFKNGEYVNSLMFHSFSILEPP